MKDTSLTHIHKELGAKLVPFAGYQMPLQYQGVSSEHQTVRTGVGVFDVSHMGEFFLKGENALDLIQKITTNDASKLTPGKAQYSCMPNERGGIIDDLIVYMIGEKEYMLVVNAANIQKDWDWINSHNDFGVTLENQSDQWSLLAIQGPKAIQAMQSLTYIDLSKIKFYTFEIARFAGLEDVIVSATGYTGSGGFEIYVKNEDAPKVWKKVFEAGSSFGIQPVGLAARDTLRLDMGYCLYGNDIDDTTSPIEAGLGWITKFTKKFINDDFIKEQKENGPTRKLIAFELSEKGIPRKGYPILNADKTKIGTVTSGTMSPSVKKGIGMGYVPSEISGYGNEIFIQIRKKTIPAVIVKLPFYRVSKS